MKLTPMDRSNYFKGLLLLIGKDNTISPSERELLLAVGKTLNFEPKFCEDTIDNLLENQHIVDEPALFSDPRIARMFIKDGFRMALVDHNLSIEEIEWLHQVAIKNKISSHWFSKELADYLENSQHNPPENLEIQDAIKKLNERYHRPEFSTAENDIDR